MWRRLFFESCSEPFVGGERRAALGAPTGPPQGEAADR